METSTIGTTLTTRSPAVARRASHRRGTGSVAGGRITAADAGLWNDSHTVGFTSVAQSIKAAGAVVRIQIGHAGRKAAVPHIRMGACCYLGESIQVLTCLAEAGLDFVDVGLSLETPEEQATWGPNFIYAQRIRAQTGLPVGTSWQIAKVGEADTFIRKQQLDFVFMARAVLANPHWPYQAARDLHVDDLASVLPTPYACWLRNWVN